MDSNSRKLKRIDPKGITLWERSYPVHHALRFFEPENILVATVLENSRIRGVLAEYSSIVALHPDGSLFSYFSGIQNISILEQVIRNYSLRLRTNLIRRDALFEDTHANSIYKIPPNILSTWHPAFKAGNFIVTLGRLYGVMILDKSLQNVLWFKEIPSERYIHDAQVTTDGKILYYQNAFNKNNNSRIEIIDPVQNTVVWYYPKDKSMTAPAQGGAQILEDGRVLFSDITGEASSLVIVDRYGNLQLRKVIPENAEDYQEVKRLDLTDYLRNSL